MDLHELERFAEEKLREYGLAQVGWRFAFDRARVRFGACKFDAKLVTVSRALAEINEPAECFDTVLLEIAHAMAGRRAGHGPLWKAACRRVGARPKRCYNREEVKTLAAEKMPRIPKFIGVCPACSKQYNFYRKQNFNKACGSCCVKHTGGRFDERFRLRVYMVRRAA